jgi:hypothetical protein
MGWSEGIGSDNHGFETTEDRMTSGAMKYKPFRIDKRELYMLAHCLEHA